MLSNSIFAGICIFVLAVASVPAVGQTRVCDEQSHILAVEQTPHPSQSQLNLYRENIVAFLKNADLEGRVILISLRGKTGGIDEEASVCLTSHEEIVRGLKARKDNSPPEDPLARSEKIQAISVRINKEKALRSALVTQIDALLARVSSVGKQPELLSNLAIILHDYCAAPVRCSLNIYSPLLDLQSRSVIYNKDPKSLPPALLGKAAASNAIKGLTEVKVVGPIQVRIVGFRVDPDKGDEIAGIYAEDHLAYWQSALTSLYPNAIYTIDISTK